MADRIDIVALGYCSIDHVCRLPRLPAGDKVEAAELFIPLGDLVDVAKETARLTKERDSVQRDIERGEAKLNNPGFTGKAPAQLVEQEREKLAVARDKLAKLNARIEDLANM